MTLLRLAACAAVIGCAAPAGAQAGPYDGEWIVEMRDGHGVARRGADNIVLKLDGAGGTYQNMSHGLLESNTCSRVQAEVERVVAEADTLEFTVVRSRKLPACTDFRLAFRREGDKLVGKVVRRGGADAEGNTYVARRR